MANKVYISSRLTDQSKPSIAFLDNLIANNNKGIKTGKLRIAINVPLFWAFDAMAETKVKITEKPKMAINKPKLYKPKSWIGFPKTKL